MTLGVKYGADEGHRSNFLGTTGNSSSRVMLQTKLGLAQHEI